ncbi:MAG TPA: site-specific integrase [Streptosporangiaceae bacterium]|jgi:integrase|nr:site-specific integrase [Streptosporangiaceae bacterium]
MARTRDLWHKTAAGPDGKPVKARTSRYGRGKRWLAVWAGPDGQEATRAFARKSDADRYSAGQETDAARGTYLDPRLARMTVDRWCDSWLAGYATRRPSTVRQARVHVKQIRAEFGAMLLGSVRPSHVKAWTSRLRGEDLAVSYVYALHNRLAQIMSDAVHDGLIPRSPCSRRTSPGGASQRAYVATTEQVWALHDAMPARLRAAILLGAFAGLRVAEACGLRVADVDFMRGIVHPRVQYPAEELKSETSRTAVPIPRALALELAASVERWPGATLLNDGRGAQLGPWMLERAIRDARGKVEGLPEGFRYHDLRHYLASLLIASGGDVKTVQARLRHASAKTTLDTYGHMWPDKDESTRAAIDAVLAARAEQIRNGEGAQ